LAPVVQELMRAGHVVSEPRGLRTTDMANKRRAIHVEE